jgi:NADPH2:quinone reductase
LSHAIRIPAHGGPEVLQWETWSPDPPGRGELRLRHTAVGVNFIDIYFRTGLYTPPALPFVPGMEGAGIVEAVGDGVTGFDVGDRVAYASAPLGSYAERRCMPAGRVVRLPGDIDDRTAAAVMLKGLTARYLLKQTHPVEPGETILFHAGAGGVGSLACQWAKRLGAHVITTVGSRDKADKALGYGCDHAIVYTEEDVVARVRELTDGQGVSVVYDSVGQATFMQSLDCLAPRGHMVSFGQSSGAVAAFDITLLSAKGSLTLTRPTLATYTATPEALQDAADDLFAVVGSGTVSVEVGQIYPLAQAGRAHAALEARTTTGATLLEP